MHFDTTLQTQIDLLFYFSGSIEELFEENYRLYARHIFNKNDYPLIFTRQTCLYATEQIINSDMVEIQGFTMAHSWQKLFQYLLCVNFEITKQSNKISESPKSLEELSPKLLPLNELSISVNPLYTPFRGYKLFEYFSQHPNFSSSFTDYFEKNYKIPFDHFIYELLSMAYGNNKEGKNDITNELTGEKLDTSFFYSVKLDDQTLFNSLSLIFKNEKIERLISIKKYPFYKMSGNKYLLLDSVLLMDKAYSQFINDFWFDSISQLGYDNRYYRGELGYFFEKYVREIFNYCFLHAKHHTIKTFDELKTKTAIGEDELADIYLRYNKKVFIAQVKSTGFRRRRYSNSSKSPLPHQHSPPSGFITNGDKPQHTAQTKNQKHFNFAAAGVTVKP